MWQWLSDHAQAINVLANIGMLIVWLTYLQVFLAGYRRERRAKMLVNRGGGTDLGASCLLSNMSAEPIYVQSIVARLEVPWAVANCQLTDLENLGKDGLGGDPMRTLKQGPLRAGGYIDIGTFEDVVQRSLERIVPEEKAEWLDALQALEVTIVGVYGPDDLFVGAVRRFECRHEDGVVELSPTTIATRQIRSRRERRRLETLLLGDLCRIENRNGSPGGVGR